MLQKIKDGWKLANECWRVLQLDRELLIFPFLSLIALLLVLASFAAPFWTSGQLQAFAEGTAVLNEAFLFAVFLLSILLHPSSYSSSILPSSPARLSASVVVTRRLQTGCVRQPGVCHAFWLGRSYQPVSA